MRKLYVVLCIGLLLGACSPKVQHEEYNYNEAYNYFYRLHSFGSTNRTAHASDVVTAIVEFCPFGADSLLFRSEFEIPVRKSDSLILPLLFLNSHEGDSLDFIVPTQDFECESYIPFEFAELMSVAELQIKAKVLEVLDSAAFNARKRELELQRKAMQEYENLQIQHYLEANTEPFVKLPQGIFKHVIKDGFGARPQRGDMVTVTYQGSFLNGELACHFITQDFSFGSQMQVIEGLEIALKTMQQGERAKVVIPSKYAWGEKGSQGLIPPYTPIIFDVELKTIGIQ